MASSMPPKRSLEVSPELSFVLSADASLSMSPVLPFPLLPNELVIHILEIAARNSHAAAYSISLATKWARDLAIPYLFSTVVCRYKPSFSAGMSSGAQGSPHARTSSMGAWGHLVQNLWLESVGMTNISKEEQCVSACPSVESIALKSGSLRLLLSYTHAQKAYHREQTARARLTPQAFPNTSLSRMRSVMLISATMRYDWHSLDGVRLPNGSRLLHNITHVRLLKYRYPASSSFSPHSLLPNLTHLALPYPEIGNQLRQAIPYLPPGLLECQSLRMLVLTVAEETWLNLRPYELKRNLRITDTSPKTAYRTFVEQATKGNDRLHVVLSPRLGVDPCDEWVGAARGGLSLWEVAAKVRKENSHGEDLPDVYTVGVYRWRLSPVQTIETR